MEKLKPDSLSSIAMKKAEKTLKSASFIGLFIGLIGLIGYPISISGKLLIFIGILLASATFMSSFFIGTLFGMPKRNDELNSSYSVNNSLVEISDWLTKIIVGLGLVNLKQIPVYLMAIGKYISDACGNIDGSISVFSITVVLYFAALGIYIGYNYMRLVLSQKYKIADDNILTKVIQEKNTLINEQKVEKEKLKEEILEKDIRAKSLLQEINKTTDESGTIKISRSIESFKLLAEDRLKAGMLENPEDPQKGQWGKLAIRNDRELKARVRTITKEFFRIHLEVVSTDNNNPLKEGETVIFALHPSFGKPPLKYSQVKDGVAEIKLYAYGSFTVGALVDKGTTELELDLAELPGVSDYFKEN
ncbi:MAG: hypothetical protein QM710_03865 [Flavobacterium sp.]